MITAQQAHLIADELIAQEQARSVALRNATARRIPRVFQCAELQPLPAWQRRAVVDAAYKNVARRPFVVGPAMAWAIGWSALAWNGSIPPTLGVMSVWWLVPIVHVPLIVIYTVLIRREIRRRAGAAANTAAIAPAHPESEPIQI